MNRHLEWRDEKIAELEAALEAERERVRNLGDDLAEMENAQSDRDDEIADRVIKERVENCCCPECCDSEGHTKACSTGEMEEYARKQYMTTQKGLIDDVNELRSQLVDAEGKIEELKEQKIRIRNLLERETARLDRAERRIGAVRDALTKVIGDFNYGGALASYGDVGFNVRAVYASLQSAEQPKPICDECGTAL